jgi:hypothetical protein
VYIIPCFPVLFAVILSISAVLTVYICCILYILFYFFAAVINFAGAYMLSLAHNVLASAKLSIPDAYSCSPVKILTRGELSYVPAVFSVIVGE